MTAKDTTPAENYFHERMAQLGITDNDNRTLILQTNPDNTLETNHQWQPIFLKYEREGEHGIEIRVSTLDRVWITYEPKRDADDKRKWKKRWSIIRWANPAPGKPKYQMPRGNGSFPFFPPSLIEKFHAKTPIDTLVITEGFFKAFKAHLHGIDCIGLPSITHMKNRENGGLFEDIQRIIINNGVKRVIWLTDGDCLNVSDSLVDEDGKTKDLSARPYNFFNSIKEFKQLLEQFSDVEKYFYHINTDDIDGSPKGLDDLLVAMPNQVDDIKADLINVSRPNGPYFTKFNVSYSLSKVYKYFHIDTVDSFYLFHVEKRKDLKDARFKFRGTMYQWNEKENRCDVMVPGDAENYFRVGDDYFEWVQLPNQYKQLERVFQSRKKGTILDDHGKTIINHIKKFKAFCNVPDHITFQPALYNCFNVYSPLEFMADEDECTMDDCPTIVGMIKHIFGDAQVQCQIGGEVFKTTMFEMGMDYMQLLYQKPQEKLPILCLVSKENNTGKSTLGNFLRLMLASNVAIVGNQDIAADFNAHWATKLVVVCDEAKIEKHTVVEKVKMLSTAKKVMMNAKGRNQVEIDCFIKFILVTNNEENFIHASEEDIRFWVIKVPKLKTDNPNIAENFVQELPAFLSYLNTRQLSTTKQGRMWFHPQLLKTEALRKVIAHSQPTIEKELRQHMRDMFLDFGVETVMMTRAAIHKEFFKNRYEASYLERIIKDNLKCDQFHVMEKVDGQDEPVKKYKTCRHTYPKWEEVAQDGKKRMVRVDVHDNGRPYVFNRDMFLTQDEIATTIIDQANQFQNDMTPTPVSDVFNKDDWKFQPGVGIVRNDGQDAGSDLPF